MAVSAVALLWRFRGAALAGVVTLYFSALTVMLFTMPVWNPSVAFQIAVGGVRYFSLVSVLPLFHILLTLLEPHPAQRGAAIRDVVSLALQTAILLLVILARGSAMPLIGGIALVCAVLAWRHRHNPSRLRSLLREFAVIGFVGVGCLTVAVVVVPREYLTEGRFGAAIWQRVTESFGVNPAWPFAGVNDMFDCAQYVPTGMLPGTKDSNGLCIWLDYASKHHIPIETATAKLYDSTYETALREAFFNIAARYPGEALKTFFYYKPRLIAWSIAKSLSFNFSGAQSRATLPDGLPVVPYPPVALGLLLASAAVALVQLGIVAASMTALWRIAAVTVLSALFTLPSYFAAWAMPHTSGDLLLYCLFGLGLALGVLLVAVRSVLDLHAASS
jgi:hypothetical protein